MSENNKNYEEGNIKEQIEDKLEFEHRLENALGIDYTENTENINNTDNTENIMSDNDDGIRDVNTDDFDLGDLNLEDLDLDDEIDGQVEMNEPSEVNLDDLNLDEYNFGELNLEETDEDSEFEIDDLLLEDEPEEELNLENINEEESVRLQESNTIEGTLNAVDVEGINVENYVRRMFIYTLASELNHKDNVAFGDINHNIEHSRTEYSKQYYNVVQYADAVLSRCIDIAKDDIKEGKYTGNIQDYVPKDLKDKVIDSIAEALQPKTLTITPVDYRTSIARDLRDYLKIQEDKLNIQDKTFVKSLRAVKDIIDAKSNYLNAVAELKTKETVGFINKLYYQKITTVSDINDMGIRETQGHLFTLCDCSYDEEVKIPCDDMFELYIVKPGGMNFSDTKNDIAEMITRNYTLTSKETTYNKIMIDVIMEKSKQVMGLILAKPVKCPRCGKYHILTEMVTSDLEKAFLNKSVNYNVSSFGTITKSVANVDLLRSLIAELHDEDIQLITLEEESIIKSEREERSRNVFANLKRYINEYERVERSFLEIGKLKSKEDYTRALMYSVLANNNNNLTKALTSITKGACVELANTNIFEAISHSYNAMLRNLTSLIDFDKWIGYCDGALGLPTESKMSERFSPYQFDTFTRNFLGVKKGARYFRNFTSAISETEVNTEVLEKVRPKIVESRKQELERFKFNLDNYMRNRKYLLNNPHILDFRYFKEHSADKTNDIFRVLGTGDETVEFLSKLTDRVCQTFAIRRLQLYKKFVDLNTLITNKLNIPATQTVFIDDDELKQTISKGYALAKFMEKLRKLDNLGRAEIYDIIYDAITSASDKFNFIDKLKSSQEFQDKQTLVKSNNDLGIFISEIFLSEFFTNESNFDNLVNQLGSFKGRINNLMAEEKSTLNTLTKEYTDISVERILTINKTFYKDIQSYINQLEKVEDCYQTFKLNNYVAFNHKFKGILSMFDDIQFKIMSWFFGLNRNIESLREYEPDMSVSYEEELRWLLKSAQFSPDEISNFIEGKDLSKLEILEFAQKGYSTIEKFISEGAVNLGSAKKIKKPYENFFNAYMYIQTDLRSFVLLKNSFVNALANIKQPYTKEIDVVTTLRNLYIVLTLFKGLTVSGTRMLEKISGITMSNLVSSYVKDTNTVRKTLTTRRNNLDHGLYEQPLYPNLLGDVYTNTVRLIQDENTTVDENGCETEKSVVLETELDEIKESLAFEIGTDEVERIQKLLQS